VVFADLYFRGRCSAGRAGLVPWKMARAKTGETAAASGGAPQARLLKPVDCCRVVFFSLSKGQQDLYVLPFVVAGAAWSAVRSTSG
jgi:hypothetical protein